MIATNNSNFLNIEDMFKFDIDLSFFTMIRQYILVIKRLNSIDKTFTFMNRNIEIHLEINNLNNIQKIDNILLKLEEFSEMIETVLESGVFNKWYHFLMLYTLQKVQNSSMSLQAMLGVKQAQMMSPNGSN